MDRPSEVRVWAPAESATLEGVFHLEGGLNPTVQAEDGTRWLLVAAAEEQLQALDPFEGQVVQVLCVQDGHGPSTYHVALHRSRVSTCRAIATAALRCNDERQEEEPWHRTRRPPPSC